MKLYIAGPMSGLPDYNYPAFNNAERILRAYGYETLNPARRSVVDGWEWVDYMRPALRDVSECDGLCALDGWENSRGAKIEVGVVQSLGLPVRTLVEWVEAA